ncbi:hypothetical protein B0T24DRAFT_596437 [Lasiosphaeria ovina]|uniref:Uncharacterized protein n=1 Tax=Lasiosphaeria ovina TaxID=92902 RepID=A0AAE0K481_9PEZI|nr:hypothetical protein B0T24DRAFT_596437 [Lasiosphaeria ovina]
MCCHAIIQYPRCKRTAKIDTDFMHHPSVTCHCISEQGHVPGRPCKEPKFLHIWRYPVRCDACINDLKNEQTMQIGLHINKLEYQFGYNTALFHEVIKEMCKFFDEKYDKRLASLMASSLSAKNTWEQAFAQIAPTQPLRKGEDLIRSRDMRVYINYDAFNAQMIRIAEDAERFAVAKIKLLHTSVQQVLREEIEEIEGRYNKTSSANANPDDKNTVNSNADGNGNMPGTVELYPRVADRYGFYDYLAQDEVLVQGVGALEVAGQDWLNVL